MKRTYRLIIECINSICLLVRTLFTGNRHSPWPFTEVSSSEWLRAERTGFDSR